MIPSHHIATAQFSGCRESQEIGNLFVDPFLFEETLLHQPLLLQVGWIEQQKTFEVGHTPESLEQVIQYQFQIAGDGRHYM